MKETISLQVWTQEEYLAEGNERIILYDLGIREVPPNNLIARSPIVHVSSLECWHSPPARAFNLNVDGSGKGNLGPIEFGGAIRNSKGDIISLL